MRGTMAKDKSTLLGELDVLSEPRRNECLFMVETAHFSDEDKEALALALANPKYTTKAILQVCQARGAKFSKWAVGHHRNKECNCVTGG
jgi:hypothetical protein